MNKKIAIEVLENANKIIKKRTLFKKTKIRKALEKYIEAGSLFKMEKNNRFAGNCYIQSAECYEKLHQLNDAAAQYIVASKCYESCDRRIAKEALDMAIDIYVELNIFNAAARYLEQVEELCNTTYDKILYLQRAISYYSKYDQTYNIVTCSIKVAIYLIDLQFYTEAINHLKKVLMIMKEKNTLKYQSIFVLYHILLCCVALGDFAVTNRILDECVQIDNYFKVTAEYEFIKTINKCYEMNDIKTLNDVVKKHDMTKPLTDYEFRILLRIRDIMSYSQFDMK